MVPSSANGLSCRLELLQRKSGDGRSDIIAAEHVFEKLHRSDEDADVPLGQHLGLNRISAVKPAEALLPRSHFPGDANISLHVLCPIKNHFWVHVMLLSSSPLWLRFCGIDAFNFASLTYELAVLLNRKFPERTRIDAKRGCS